MKRKVVVLILALAIVLSAFPVCSSATNTSGLSNFTSVKTYTSGQFEDVTSKSYFETNIARAYELGLMNGISLTQFDESGYVTAAQAIALAARIHSIYYDGCVTFGESNPWYQSAVDYALKNGIIATNWIDYTINVTREEYATIMAAALPDSAFDAINDVKDNQIPDVPMERAFSSAVYKLYRAGIMVGNDDTGTFLPDSYIQRGQVAALVTRMVDKSLRVKIALLSETTDETERVVCEYSNVTMLLGKTIVLNVYDSYSDNGWIHLDNSDLSIISTAIADEWTDANNINIFVSGKQVGSAVITLYTKDSKGNFLAQDIVKINVIEGTDERLYSDMALSSYSIEVPLYTYQTVDASYFDSECENVYFSYSLVSGSSDIISLEWGNWNDNSIPLVIKGKNLGDATIYIELYDSDTGAFLNEKILHVNVY